MVSQKKLYVPVKREEREPSCREACLIREEADKRLDKPSLLLHSCCGPCSTSVIEKMVTSHNVTVFFYNPNITDVEEYEKRKESQIQFIKNFNRRHPEYAVGYHEGLYEPEVFYQETEGLEGEPEGSKRCEYCFRLRLERTAQTAGLYGFDTFGTTLSVSPHKDYSVILSLGKRLAIKYSRSFLDMNFKKNDGYKRSIEMSKEYRLYRQRYCGCQYSNWEE